MKRKVIFSLLMLVLIAVATVSAWQVYVPLQEDAESVRAYIDLTAYVHLPEISVEPGLPKESPLESEIPVEESMPSLPQVDFEALRAINPDVVGWIIIDGTNINYPVVQGGDNQYYLRHLFTGEYNASGCIFLDSRNSWNFTDPHSILYGHHMGNGTMFNGLMDYKEQEFYDTHPSALLLTPGGTWQVEFFAGYVADVRDNAWQVDFLSEEDFTGWLYEIKSKSLIQSPIEPSQSGSVLTLSTCSYEFSNARFVLHGFLTILE